MQSAFESLVALLYDVSLTKSHDLQIELCGVRQDRRRVGDGI
jgi:hypothetical protein